MRAGDVDWQMNVYGGVVHSFTEPEADSVAIFTNDVTPESTQAIRDGGIVAETHHGFAEWGWFGAETAVKLACDMDVEPFQDIRPRIAWQGNADLFYPDPELPELEWEQIAEECL
jgi:ribose transport system substrate-binding protein